MIAILALALTTITTPHVGHGCYSSQFQLGTGNVTSNAHLANDPSTNVVNIWAFIDNESKPIAWLYKNKSADMYVVWRPGRNSNVQSIVNGSSLANFFTPSHGSYKLRSIDPSSLVELENLLGAKGFVRASCFSSDLK